MQNKPLPSHHRGLDSATSACRAATASEGLEPVINDDTTLQSVLLEEETMRTRHVVMCGDVVAMLSLAWEGADWPGWVGRAKKI